MALQPREALKTFFGYDTFRPNQEQVVEAIMAGRDVLAVMPTGAGKSICFQTPALCLPGYTLVLSPLISLMADQVQALRQSGVAASCLNSASLPQERREALHQAASGACKLLYAAPERLQNEEFRAFCQAHPPALAAIDEAHCVSQWGHNFRPDYVAIAPFLDALPVRPPVAAFTATATQAVQEDIVQLLALRNPYCQLASFDRPNLSFAVQRPPNRQSKREALLSLCRKHAGQCGIVYCQTRKAVDEVCDFLTGQGLATARYHAGLSLAERRMSQEDFVYDRKLVMVATNAFGMGIDKSNVSFVIHYNMPLDLEGYYQEAGRAGRDGEAADCVLLYSPKDRVTAEFLIDAGFADQPNLDPALKEVLRDRALDRLKQMTFYATTTHCLRHFILDYFGENAPLFCGHCGNCTSTFVEEDATLEAQKIISCVYRLQERNRVVGRSTIVAILRGSKDQKILNSGFDTLSTYAIMAESSTHRVRSILDALIDAGLLQASSGPYPVVEFCERSMSFLRNRERFVVKLPKDPEPPREKRGKGRRQSSFAPDAAQTGGVLFTRLKELRTQIAAEMGIPAYMVFNNATLHAMCVKMPRTRWELLDVPGVGEVKAERFGARFLEVIRAYEEDGGLPELI